MGRRDLGTCVIVSKEDAEKLSINLNKFQKIHDFITPSRHIFPFFMGEKRLLKYVERSAKREGADLAVIIHQKHEFTFHQEYIACEYSLYKYK
jgi:hypothetical protein